MKTIELRRHSVRGAGKGLTPHGYQLAKAARKTLTPPYRLILSSPKARCVETAEAFGFKHSLHDPRLGPLDYEAFEELEPYIKKMRKKKPGLSWIEAAFRIQGAASIFKSQAKVFLNSLADIAHFMAEGDRALAVTHADVIEAVALLGFPRYDLAALGKPFNPCEGVEFGFENGRLAQVRPIRLQVLGKTGIVTEAPAEEPEVPEEKPVEAPETEAAGEPAAR